MRITGNGFLARLGALFTSWLDFFRKRLGLAESDGRELLEGEMTWEELDAEIASLERHYGMSSAEFYDRFVKGEMPDTAEMNAWAILYSTQRDIDKIRNKSGVQ